MATFQEYLEQADALLESDAELSVDVQSLAATYRSRRDSDDTRAAGLFARALVNRAAREGHTVEAERAWTVQELKDEIAARNDGRDEADQIRPKSQRKADLEAAIDADDAAQG